MMFALLLKNNDFYIHYYTSEIKTDIYSLWNENRLSLSIVKCDLFV